VPSLRWDFGASATARAREFEVAETSNVASFVVERQMQLVCFIIAVVDLAQILGGTNGQIQEA